MELFLQPNVKVKIFFIMLKQISLIVFIILSISTHAQSSDSPHNILKPTEQISTDTTRKLPIQQLRLLNNYMLNEIGRLNEKKTFKDWESEIHSITKEELESGLSEFEILAFRKNKQVMQNILNMTFEELWWLRVKSLGQLIGIPDIYIKMLEFALLLLL